MKYKLKILKIEEAIPDKRDRFALQDNYEIQIFEANVSPDGTIELLQHLWELKARETTKKED